MEATGTGVAGPALVCAGALSFEGGMGSARIGCEGSHHRAAPLAHRTMTSTVRSSSRYAPCAKSGRRSQASGVGTTISGGSYVRSP
jgi:hypothetical protein